MRDQGVDGPRIVPDSPAGRLLLNAGAYQGLLRQAPHVHRLVGDSLLDAKADIITFILTAAYGYTTRFDAEYGSRSQRLRYLLGINPHVFRLHLAAPDRGPVRLVVGEGRNTVWDFGRVEGFTAVLPLSVPGYERYMSNQAVPQDFGPKDLVEEPFDRNALLRLMITGVFHVPSLELLFVPSDDRDRLAGRASGLLVTLFRHLALFAPLLRVVDRRAVVRAGGTGELPVVVCPITGRGMGRGYLEASGFRDHETDAGGSRKFVLDLSRVAPDGPAGGEERWLAVNAVRALIHHYRKSPYDSFV